MRFSAHQARGVRIAHAADKGGDRMPKRQTRNALNVVLVLAAAALSACSHAEAVLSQAPAPETTGSTAAPKPPPVAMAARATPLPTASTVPATPPAPMTREKASTDCWMKYEKEGRGLSLDKRLPLVEKCTAEKLKAGR